jgi:ABC-2 type transport system ATP-binding protein
VVACGYAPRQTPFHVIAPMIRVQNLAKYYGGKRALGPVSFEISDGETVGFLGLNGAGKTTALRILACDLRPSAGTVSVGEVDAVANPHEVRKKVGFLPENPPLYADMTVNEYLRFAGRLRQMSAGEVDRRLPQVLELTDLGEVRHDLIGQLSHGYRQRVGVAQAIVHEPRLLILDEPTRGLDPVQIVEMRSLIRNLKEKHTVLISSHILTEISQTCDRLLVLGRGAILAAGTEDALSSDLVQVRRVTVAVGVAAEARAAVTTALEGVEGVTAVKHRERHAGGEVFELSSSEDVRARVSRAVVEAGWDLLELAHSTSELESVFLKLVQGGADARN